MDETNKQQVQTQFGDKAAAYAGSAVHAKGASLARLVELVAPQAHWLALDVATAAGHTARALAPHVRAVVATDLTVPMLPKARALAREVGVDNLLPAGADAESLPFPPNTFHLVTCRIAAHHFPHVDRFLAEAARVLRPGGILGIVDNIVPGSGWSGKKADRQRAAGRYVNAFEALRDPSHHRCLSIYQWRDAFAPAGFAIQHEETLRKEMDFAAWTARMNVPPDDVTRLRAMLVQAPDDVLEFLTPQFQGDRITFTLTELIIIGKLVKG